MFIPNRKLDLMYHPGGDDPANSKSNHAPDIVGVPGTLEDYKRLVNSIRDGNSASEEYLPPKASLVATSLWNGFHS